MRALVLLLFTLSGALGLAYEVLWSRALLLVLGSTAASNALVLGVFVAGLGLGARWGGQRMDATARPLRFYGVMELIAAAWVLVSLALIPLLDAPYAHLVRALGTWSQLPLRALVVVLVVLPGAWCLGATLPALVTWWTRQQDRELRARAARSTAWLYGANTLGAVAGALAMGWYAIGIVGVRMSGVSAACVGVLVGALAFVMDRSARGHDTEDISASTQSANATSAVPSPDNPVRAMPPSAVLALLCGAIGLGIEIVGFRVLVFFVEGFTASLASMLAVFVLGLALGSLMHGAHIVKTDRPARRIGILLALVGVVALAEALFLVPRLESAVGVIKSVAFERVATPADIAQGVRIASFLGAALLLFVPAYLLGPTFALCVRAAECEGREPGPAVGRTYLFNALGSVIAPSLVVFVLMPWVGVVGAAVGFTVLALATGSLLLCRMVPARAALIASCVALLAVLLLPAREATEAFLRTTHVLRAKEGRGPRALLDLETDAITTASVVETAERERILYTDDFAAAATGRHYRYMRLLGLLPGLMAERVDNVMVIAFGTGTTAGSIAALDDVKRIEVVEVSPAVLSLASWFREANRNVLNDPRVVPIVDDGRNALRTHAPDLDVITLEPLMPYSPAGQPLYAREFYELAKSRLREGGVLCQWVPVHAMPAELYAAYLKTFFEVFPDGDLWYFEQSTALIGRHGGREPTKDVFERRRAAVQGDLDDAGLGDPVSFATAWVADGGRVLGRLAPSSGTGYGLRADRTVTDDDPYPELYPTPRASLRTPYLADTLAYLATLADPKDASGKTTPRRARVFDPEDAEGIASLAARGLGARALDARASFYAVGGGEDGLAAARDTRAQAVNAYQRHPHAQPARQGDRRATRACPSVGLRGSVRSRHFVRRSIATVPLCPSPAMRCAGRYRREPTTTTSLRPSERSRSTSPWALHFETVDTVRRSSSSVTHFARRAGPTTSERA